MKIISQCRQNLGVPVIVGLALILTSWGCRTGTSASNVEAISGAQTVAAVESLIPADRLSKIKAALPQLDSPALQDVLNSPDTLWYDHDVMTPAYQDSTGNPLVGAGSNAQWFRLIAGSLTSIARQIYNVNEKRWQFPFATTAGTDVATNYKVVNFIRLPRQGTELMPVAISIVSGGGGIDRKSWNWLYPKSTVIGELIFVTDGQDLYPAEIRTRIRLVDSWAANVYRPFPTAVSLSNAIKAKRSNWASDAKLNAMITHLNNPATLTPKRLTAQGLPGTFDQAGALDVLPDFGDSGLVKELLTTIPFTSTWGLTWKENPATGLKTYAASTQSAFSIVPTGYQAGMFEVTDTACARCHNDTGKLLQNWHGNIALYGEVWGKDGIFSFHPFDQNEFPNLNASRGDNRKMNPKLRSMGVIDTYNASKHTSAFYNPLKTN